jgi:hypothetical protein
MYDLGHVMNPLPLYPIKIIACFALVAWFGAGVYLFKNQDRIFAAHPDTGVETSGTRHYSKAQAWLVWLGIAHLFIFLALI